ncbi:NUDIX domain-containing protein, partial [Acinetobacter baumannii]|nr:NUDIX domain-containing protein [Acinetobacter baumannii]EKX6532229.1 NUDIX domain-containing protein [Acinetobacter baumannii]
MPKPIVDVAIAILIHRGKILVGWRGEQQHQGGKHEFPGGKVEQGETPEEACR